MNKIKALSVLSIVLVMLIACNKNNIDTNTIPNKEVYLDLPDKPYTYFQQGGTNQSTKLNYMATLGRVLFYDGHLSVNNATACANCHKQEFAFSDNVAFSRGFENRPTGRNSMAIQDMGTAFMNSTGELIFSPQALFWDGRSSSLLDLVTRPITNHVEMGIDNINEIPDKLVKLGFYDKLFEDAFGDDEITVDRISQALSAFMSSIQVKNTRFDNVQRGLDKYTTQEQMGMQLFNGKYNCDNCHRLQQGAYGSSVEFMNIGLNNTADQGRSTITRNANDAGSFRAPNLRNVALTAPYMHDGRFETLEDVIGHYSNNINDDPNLDFRLKDANGKPMKMNISSDETQALVAFLNTLTDHKMVTDIKFSNPFKVK